jgi:hypothetical protein
MGPELLPRCADRGQPSVGLAADRVSPGAGGLTGKAALLRSSLSENHRGGVRHGMYGTVCKGGTETCFGAATARPIDAATSPESHCPQV